MNRGPEPAGDAVISLPPRAISRRLIEALWVSVLLMGASFLINAHQGLSWADEGLLWYGSQRVLAGEIPVRDFFSYDPGRYYWTAAFYSLLSDSSLRTTFLAGSVFAGLALTATLFTLEHAGMGRKWRWLLAVAICIAFSFPRHKIYEQALSLVLACAIYGVLTNTGSAKRWGLLGLATGLAAVMGRNHGVFFLAGSVLTFGYLLLSRPAALRVKNIATYGVGVVIGYSPIWLLCLFSDSFFQSFWTSLLQTAGWQLPLQIPFLWTIDFASIAPSWRWHAAAVGVICLLIPLTYLFSAAWVARQDRINQTTRLHLLLASFSFAGLPYLHQALDRADFGHMAQGFLPSLGALVCVGVLASKRQALGRAIQALSLVLLVTVVATWMPYVPYLRLSNLEATQPGSTAVFTMDGTDYRVERYQASLMTRLRQLKEACGLSDAQFLAAPHFPGLYAFLHLDAPHWDSYYVYSRPPSLQQAHLAAMPNIKLAWIAPEATIDGIERLKFGNIYGESLRYLESHLDKRAMDGFPSALNMYVKPGSCAP